MEPDNGAALAQELLRVYRLALQARRTEVAEHILRALELLAASEPACVATLDQAYLLLGRRRSSLD